MRARAEPARAGVTEHARTGGVTEHARAGGVTEHARAGGATDQLVLDPSALADAEQRRASDPAASVFVSANAGSGKTKLLVDRLLRLLLGGAEPGRIQCLTYTRAAAAEMAVRLNHRLGQWVASEDAVLDAALLDLSVRPDEAARARARGLFATVLDLPGGMRIGTIHAFCEGLLKRFPLEARLSPHFRLIEDADRAVALQAEGEAVLSRAAAAAIAVVAGLVRAAEFDELVRTLEAERARLAALLGRPEAARRRLVWLAAGAVDVDQAALTRRAVAGVDEAAMREAGRLLAADDGKKAAARGEAMLGWLALDAAGRGADWAEWAGQFLKKDGDPFKEVCPVGMVRRRPELGEALLAERDRVAAIEQARMAVLLAEATAALLELAAPVLEGFAAGKAQGEMLDFGDLIDRARRLLRDEPGAAWVLFKLDGGLDHLLLDEVQDSAPTQWDIAGALSEEFFAGLGAHEDAGRQSRTVFAVGDPKQSIYSFQGAVPGAFEDARGRFRALVERGGAAFRDGTLDVSFRSTPAVLRLVDAVFADGIAGVGATRHVAHRADAAGVVTLWPLAPRPDQPELLEWSAPARNEGLETAPQRLADSLARHVRGLIEAGVALPSRGGRALRAGDVLVLVRARSAFQRALVRALKVQGVAVAGLDRMQLTEQLAVQDLMALGDWLLLPEDDLALACVLTSPLGGLSDDELMALAAGRPQERLFAALLERADERPAWRAALDFLTTLRRRVDYVSPHALLSEALGPLGGRARLFARLGPEAAEPVDELLAAALRFAQSHPASLQGFLHWLRRSGTEVKREAEGAGDAVRVMTVHGAKGLQAPLVILPDTVGMPPQPRALLWGEADGVAVPLWAPGGEHRASVFRALQEREKQAQRAEYNRLLYVALTRAEDQLLVCGWEGGTKMDAGCWYQLVENGMQRLAAERVPCALFDGRPEWVHRDAVPGTPAVAEPAPVMAGPAPSWLGVAPHWRPAPLPTEPVRARPLAPSRPDGVEFGEAPDAASPLGARRGHDRFRRGRVVHALLEHLPALPQGERHGAARRYVAREGEIAALAEQVLRILEDPELALLFGPGSRAEQPLVGLVGERVVCGQVDRMVVGADSIEVADFKSNRLPPARVEDTPVLYLRQMAAYRDLLRLIYPGRTVRCRLIWTEAPQAVLLPDGLMDGVGSKEAVLF